MKRLLIALGMVLGLAGATPALAGHPSFIPPTDCKAINSLGNWPTGYVYTCGAGVTPQQASDVYSAIGSQGNSNFIQSQMIPNGGVFLIWANPTTYNHDFGFPTGDFDGFTQITGGVPQYTFLIVSNILADIAGSDPLGNTSVHELGHWLDYLDGIAITKSKQVSLTSQFTTGVTQDWKVFNGTVAVNGVKTLQCGPFNPNTGNTPIFTGQQDPTKLPTVVYICSGAKGTGSTLNTAGGYSGTSQSIVKKLYDTFQTNGNIFAESLPVILGFRDDGSGTVVKDDDHFMDNSVSAGLFGCSENLVSSMFFNGTLPSTSPPGLTCPTN